MLISIQALRAFAAWLVVFQHFMQVCSNFETDNAAGHLLSTHVQIGVDVFFVISGFGEYPILPVGRTLNFEMMFYLILALSFLLPARIRMWAVIVMVALLNLLLSRLDMISNFYVDPIIHEFLLGIGLGMLYRRGKLSPATTYGPRVMMALGCAMFMLCFTDQSSWRLATRGMPAVLLVIAMIRLEPIFIRCRGPGRMGDQSYSVYLVHVIVLWLANALLYEHWGLPVWLTLSISIAIIATLSWASFDLLEKRLSHRLRLSPRVPRAA